MPPAADAADPHGDQPILTHGPAPGAGAAAVVVLVHGRGATAESMLALYRHIAVDDVAVLAPRAAGNTWYPQSFLAPLPGNQPHLDSALNRLRTVVDDVLARGVPPGRVAVLGFSQGACLTSEFVARNPRRYGAVMALTGGLIGPPGAPRDYAGSLDGTPVFLGTSDPDPHVPYERVLETRATFARMRAAVELRRYPGMPHTVNDDELAACRALLRRMVEPVG